MEIYRIFQNFAAAHLERVHVEETSNNSFDYAGETTTAPGLI
jgi:6-pyruvoyltetrahydropterin/6-carboxytetrahydropterin synthase